MLVGLAMAGTSCLHTQTHFVCNAVSEICSAHPTSGGPYYWAAMISKPQGAPFASWVTGWFNLLGQIAVTTGIGSVIGSQLHTNLSLICVLASRAPTLFPLRLPSLQTTNRARPRRSGSSPPFFSRKVQYMLCAIYCMSLGSDSP